MHLNWREDIIIKKKMLLKAKHNYQHPLLLSVSNEYVDDKEWTKQVGYWRWKYRHGLKHRHTLVQCQYVEIKNGEITIISPENKIFIFPREQVSPLTYDEVDELLGNIGSGD